MSDVAPSYQAKLETCHGRFCSDVILFLLICTTELVFPDHLFELLGYRKQDDFQWLGLGQINEMSSPQAVELSWKFTGISFSSENILSLSHTCLTGVYRISPLLIKKS